MFIRKPSTAAFSHNKGLVMDDCGRILSRVYLDDIPQIPSTQTIIPFNDLAYEETPAEMREWWQGLPLAD